MKRYLFLITLLTALTGRIIAQSVTVDATIDSLQILIGEQAKIKLQVSLDTDKRAILPAYTDTLVRGVEIVDIAKPDTQMLNDGRRSLITQEYTVTSFDSALYYLPPMEVLVDNKAYRSKALALKVYSMPVDTLHPDQFFGPKPVMKAPFAWEDWYTSIACAVLFVPFLLLFIYLVKRIRDNKPIIRKVKVEPKLPPHQLAMQEIERIKGEKVWQKGQSKEYYTELTDAIFFFNDTATTEIYTGATPELFAKHLKEAVKIVSERKSDEHKIIFLRSWNEWAEGNYVEPDLKYGHGFLEAIKKNIIE
mgnify:CR=1 FL=1